MPAGTEHLDPLLEDAPKHLPSRPNKGFVGGPLTPTGGVLRWPGTEQWPQGLGSSVNLLRDLE